MLKQKLHYKIELFWSENIYLELMIAEQDNITQRIYMFLLFTVLQRDGSPLQRNRVRVSGGNITIEGLRRTDFGFYQCVASNEVATIVTATQLVVEGTQPHAPYNVSANASETAVTLRWLPGYSGGPDYKQDYTIWYVLSTPSFLFVWLYNAIISDEDM